MNWLNLRDLSRLGDFHGQDDDDRWGGLRGPGAQPADTQRIMEPGHFGSRGRGRRGAGGREIGNGKETEF